MMIVMVRACDLERNVEPVRCFHCGALRSVSRYVHSFAGTAVRAHFFRCQHVLLTYEFVSHHRTSKKKFLREFYDYHITFGTSAYLRATLKELGRNQSHFKTSMVTYGAR